MLEVKVCLTKFDFFELTKELIMYLNLIKHVKFLIINRRLTYSATILVMPSLGPFPKLLLSSIPLFLFFWLSLFNPTTPFLPHPRLHQIPPSTPHQLTKLHLITSILEKSKTQKPSIFTNLGLIRVYVNWDTQFNQLIPHSHQFSQISPHCNINNKV